MNKASSISPNLPSCFLFLSLLLLKFGSLKDSLCFFMSQTVVLPILNYSATKLREAAGLSNSFKLSILVDNEICALPGMVNE